MQRHDDIIISTRSLFRNFFSFYILIISYIPSRGHHNVVIFTKSLFRIISNSNTLWKLRKNISKIQILRQLCFWISREKKKLKSSVLSALTKYVQSVWDDRLLHPLKCTPHALAPRSFLTDFYYWLLLIIIVIIQITWGLRRLHSRCSWCTTIFIILGLDFL